MVKDLDFNGINETPKPRELSEILGTDIPDESIDKAAPIETDEIDEITTKIFNNLGKTFLKGEVLKRGLALMEPGQFIPVSEDAEKVSASCIRLNADSSKNGTIIPYSLYTTCVDILADAQWQIRRVYDDPNIPPDTESHSKYTVKQYNNKGGILNFIQQFFNGDGIAGAILTALAIAPFQVPGFSVMTIEEGSKAYFIAQVPPGIALFLELGIKAYRLKEFLKNSGKLSPDVEAIIDNLDTNPIARKEALSSAGIDYESFIDGSKNDDANIVLQYCGEYIAANGAIGPKNYDHWIAYGSVSARQNLVRAAFDSATDYSKDFSEAFNRNVANSDYGSGIVSAAYGIKPNTKINNVIASHFNELDQTSNDIYNDILNSFIYQVSDSDLCCLVEVFGSLDPEVLKLLATVLRLAATDLNAELARLQDAFFRQLNNLSAAAVYQIIERLRSVEDKFAVKFLKTLQDILPRFEHCPSLKDISFAISMSLDSLRRQIEKLLMDILASIDRLGMPSTLSWRVPADRRFLLTISKILDTLALKLEAADVCARKDIDQKQSDAIISDAKDQAAYEITHTLLTDGSPPSIQLTDFEIKKYFPDIQSSKSKNFDFKYGPKTIVESNFRENAKESNCQQTKSKEFLEGLKLDLLKAVEKNFKE